MCIICVEWNNLTNVEKARNLGEMWDGSQHQIEVAKRILDENGEIDVKLNNYEHVHIRKNGKNYEAALNDYVHHFEADEEMVDNWLNVGTPRLGCFVK